ncbi:MAG: PQQ-binding-like beta-propeller repeat protein [Planctomycetaceae bacterium]|nr:PQQ-binding-like beta-propeller repeat protein [Planctomycetaceae bacterium]
MSNAFQTPVREEISVLDLMYVGFNSRVVALERDTGEIVWDWKSPKGSGFVATLLDGDRVIASVQGYMYCLDALTGDELWTNPLTGMGLGVPSLTSIYGNSGSAAAAALIAQNQQAQQQTVTHTTVTS